MTNEELLQQAKDQIAQDDGFKDFAHFLEKVPSISFGNGIRANLLQRASLLAIQSAREEAAKGLEVVSEAVQTALSVGEIHFETCHLSAGAKKRLLTAQEILKKLTAPGL